MSLCAADAAYRTATDRAEPDIARVVSGLKPGVYRSEGIGMESAPERCARPDRPHP